MLFKRKTDKCIFLSFKKCKESEKSRFKNPQTKGWPACTCCVWVAETPAFLVRVSARGGGSSREEHLNAAAGLGGAAAQRRPIGYLSAARFKLETSWAIYAVTLFRGWKRRKICHYALPPLNTSWNFKQAPPRVKVLLQPPQGLSDFLFFSSLVRKFRVRVFMFPGAPGLYRVICMTAS